MTDARPTRSCGRVRKRGEAAELARFAGIPALRALRAGLLARTELLIPFWRDSSQRANEGCSH